jgi:hypothetical protein
MMIYIWKQNPTKVLHILMGKTNTGNVLHLCVLYKICFDIILEKL